MGAWFLQEYFEKSESRKDSMISYLRDLMEDATDFSWQGVKVAHAVLLCKMEWGWLSWEHTDRIDRVRRAHAQKHIPSGKPNWGRADKKPWQELSNQLMSLSERSRGEWESK